MISSTLLAAAAMKDLALALERDTYCGRRLRKICGKEIVAEAAEKIKIIAASLEDDPHGRFPGLAAMEQINAPK